MKKLLLVPALVVAVALGVSACTPRQVSESAIHQAFPVQSQYDVAVQIAQCESGLQSGAVSPGGGNVGLFQINIVHKPWVESMGYSWNDMTNPFINAKIARMLYDQAGWQPWHGTCGGRLGI